MTGFLMLLALLLPPGVDTDPALHGADRVLSAPNPSSRPIGPARAAVAEGWSQPELLHTLPNWDYWWLNTRIAADTTDTIHVLTSMHNYSVTDYDFYRDVMDVKGNHLLHESGWNGYNQTPILKDAQGRHHYIGQPVIGWFTHRDAGAVDPSNDIHMSTADTYGDIYYSLVDGSTGKFIHYNRPAVTGSMANSWSGETQLCLNSQGHILLAWSRDTHEILLALSVDGGLTFPSPMVVASDFTGQLVKVKMLVDDDDNIHFIWQRNVGTVGQLEYMKLYPNGATAVDITPLTTGSPSVWDPSAGMDHRARIHMVWSTHYEGSGSLYHTVIDGTLDKQGQPSTDAEISLVQEYVFHSNLQKKRYPKFAVDSFDNLHLIFDQGPYGCNTTKSVYYMRRSAPLTANARGIPETTGGTADFMLEAGSDYASRNYLMLSGISGTSPGTPLPGGQVILPLNWDWFTNLSLTLLGSPLFSGFAGTLDGDGAGSAQLAVGPLPAGAAGLTMYFAYCLTGPFDFASNPVDIEILP